MKSDRILIVEDNHANLMLASEVLNAEGFEILTAVDAEAALDVIGATLPDLILMDIGLPGMDGLTLTGILKSNQTTKGIVIIALTAFAMIGDDEKARAAGCDGYITKPMDITMLGAQISGYLERARSLATDGGA